MFPPGPGIGGMIGESISPFHANGAGEFSNEDFLLVGGIAPEAGLYAVFDARLLATGADRTTAQLGRIEISVRPGSQLIEGLRRMEIARGRRHRGTGRRLIQALAATAPDFQLKIHDIEPSALDFWIALGVSFRSRPEGWEASYALPSRLRPALSDLAPAQ
jgi:GNAT superfamily N-acetyltransferase